MNAKALEAFNTAKRTLEKITRLTQLSTDTSAKPVLFTDASGDAVKRALQQSVDGELKSLSFFSRRLTPAETSYSTFGRELLAAYYAVRHFRHLLEGREFIILTDHKPLTNALQQFPNSNSLRQVRQLDYIAQFTSDIRYLFGTENTVANAISRLYITAVSAFNLDEIAAEQLNDDELPSLSKSSLKLTQLLLLTNAGKIWCDVSTGPPRPRVSTSLRRKVYDHFHSLSLPSVR